MQRRGYSASLRAAAERSKRRSPPDNAAHLLSHCRAQQQRPRQLTLCMKQLTVAGTICSASADQILKTMQATQLTQSTADLAAANGAAFHAVKNQKTQQLTRHRASFATSSSRPGTLCSSWSIPTPHGCRPGRAPGAEPHLRRCEHLPQSCGSAP